jgi:ubiquinone/menaquinone biosynthesis C-methylase UbiE
VVLALLSAVALAWPGGAAGPPASDSADCIKITSRASLLHLGSGDSFDTTEGGTRAAKLVLDYLQTKRKESASAARDIYRALIPRENFGGEYTAVQWLCEYWVASPRKQKEMVADRYVASFLAVLARDDYAALKEYLRFKYRLDPSLRDSEEATLRYRFHEDFLLFNNPRRERWEKTSKFLAALGLKKGDVVADIGSGPGYYTFKFADLVGEKGKVFAIDNNESHLRYLSDLIRKFKVRNVQAVKPRTVEDIGLPGGVRVDCAFTCSLYHIVYCSFSDEERATFIGSIKRSLKPDGRLVVVDNALVEDSTLPYHGPYIAKELILAQLTHSGFTLEATHQFIPQRYMLVFKLRKGPAPKRPPAECHDPNSILVNSPVSLVQYTKPGPGFTARGRRVARTFYQALDKHDRESARAARKEYERLLPRELAGNEYSAFVWYCDYLLANPGEKKRILSDPFAADYFRYLGGDDFTVLKKYVWNKYLLGSSDEEAENPVRARAKPAEVSQDQLAAWHGFIAFNNPRRETCEKTSKVLDFLKLRPGSAVADVGCGPGYHTFKFSRLVGKEGRVYSLDTNGDMLDFVRASARKYGCTNIRPIRGYPNDTKLPADSVDVVYLCSLCPAVYVTAMEHVREQFLDSIKRALRKGGRLVIADNDVNLNGEARYAGPRIDRRLIILQLKYHGFRLVETAQFVPQRYVLVFQPE